jgi:hypothetical protein
MVIVIFRRERGILDILFAPLLRPVVSAAGGFSVVDPGDELNAIS